MTAAVAERVAGFAAEPPKPVVPPHVRKILSVVWLAILAGLLLQLAVLLLKGVLAAHVPDARAIADGVQKVSWSLIVCIALAFGSAAGKARDLLNGLIGLLAAPTAFLVARSMHKSVGQVLQLPADQTPVWVLIALGVLKAAQYGWLGVVFARLIARGAGGWRFVLAGVVGGELFGLPVVLVGVAAAPGPLPAGELIARILGEIASPVACALVLYAAESLSKQFTPAA